MQNSLNKYIEQNKLCNKTEPILVAFSGGADSVALLHLLFNAGYNVCAAHCNFKLRGNHSNNDELFVRKFCQQYSITLYVTTFDTLDYAHKNKISVEMAARQLRYNWFNKIIESNNLSKLATGHHLNDNVETVFLNLAHGTGLNGLTAIKPVNGNIIRPLLFATRMQIESYLSLNSLSWCHDHTNDSDKYRRNVIRHQIVPVMQKINSSFLKTMQQNIKWFSLAQNFIDNQITNLTKGLINVNNEQTIINTAPVINNPIYALCLFNWLWPFGFNSSQINNIASNKNRQAGKQFFSQTHKLIIDRQKIIIAPINNNSNQELTINSFDELVGCNMFESVKLILAQGYIIDKNKTVGCFDADKIEYPLTLRPWLPGDRFFPLGMKTGKKVSNFFIDIKTDRLTKEKALVLTHKNNIIWLVGFRIDNRYKIDNQTQKILCIKAK